MRNLFLVSNKFSQVDFHKFISSYNNKISGIKAFEWAPKVSLTSKDSFINQAANSLYKDFNIVELDNNHILTPVKNRDYYYPIFYVEPLIGNEK